MSPKKNYYQATCTFFCFVLLFIQLNLKYCKKKKLLLNIHYKLHFFSSPFFPSLTNSIAISKLFTPSAVKTLRSVPSVVHHHALGHNISLSGHRTAHFIREVYL